MYQIEVDTKRRLLLIEVTGFWTVRTVAAFALDLTPIVAGFGPPWGTHRIFSDFTGAELVTQPVVNALQAMMINTPVQAERIGYFTRSPLARLQLRRIAAVRQMIRIFDNHAAALAWVEEGREAASVPSEPYAISR